MRPRRPSPEHQEAVARRLAQLSAQLDASRAETSLDQPWEAEDPAAGGEWWSEHTRVTPTRPQLRVVGPGGPPLQPAPSQLSSPLSSPMAPPHLSPPSPPSSPPPAGFSPSQLPAPGRHAARRPRELLGGVGGLGRLGRLAPDTLRGHTGLGPGQVGVLAVLVAVGLALTCWWVVRGDPEPAVSVVPVTTGAAGGDALVAPAAPEDASAPVAPDPSLTAQTRVTVDVAGKVRRPGIVVLDAGARVVDAVERAGGARPGVDLTPLNLARVLVDGEQIVVGAPAGYAGAAPPVAAPVVPGVPGGLPTALVDLNLATQAELETLPDIGPVTAAAIIAWRDEHGGFSAVTELLEVAGIGDTTLAQLTPLVTV